MGLVILMTDKYHTANVIHYTYHRWKRITRSVMAADVHARVLPFDHAFVIMDMVKQAVGRSVYMEVATDSKTLVNIVANDGAATELRLQIDIFALKEAYYKAEVCRRSWIPGSPNPADALMKSVMGNASLLWRLIHTNKFLPRDLR